MIAFKKKDKELMKGFLLGERQASETIDNWIATVVGVTVGERGEHVKDLEQDIRYALILDFREQKFRYESALKTYVWRIASGNCIDYLRKKKRAPKSVNIDDIKLEPIDPGGNAEDDLDHKEKQRIFEKIFAQWPEMCRQLWKLLCDDLSYREISKKLGIAEDTARTRLFRCKQIAIELRTKLTSEGNI